MSWFEYRIENNVRNFTKKINESFREIKENKLKRLKDKDTTYKTSWSYQLLNEHNELIIDDHKRVNSKKSKFKSFKIKTLFNELPILENLKKRNPQTYNKDWKCPRCNKENETF